MIRSRERREGEEETCEEKKSVEGTSNVEKTRV